MTSTINNIFDFVMFPSGGRGGGVLYLNVSHMLHVEGLVSADGQPGTNNVAGGGAGGSIHVHAAILEGSGTFQVS